MTPIEVIKSQTDIAEVAKELGSTVRGDRATAAWRNGDGLNVNLDRERGLFYDHRDGRGGDVFNLVQLSRGCDFIDARKWLEDFNGIAYGGRPYPTSSREPEQRLLPRWIHADLVRIKFAAPAAERARTGRRSRLQCAHASIAHRSPNQAHALYGPSQAR